MHQPQIRQERLLGEGMYTCYQQRGKIWLILYFKVQIYEKKPSGYTTKVASTEPGKPTEQK